MAETANRIVEFLKTIGKTRLVSLCGDIRRMTTSLARIEIIAAKKFSAAALKKYIVLRSSGPKETNGVTVDEFPISIYHTTANKFQAELFRLTGNKAHVTKVLSQVK